jgi:putative spermidine/putrescine transport system permease protein
MMNRVSTFLYRRPRLILALMLLPPMIWFVVVYLGALATMLLNSFFYLDGFTGKVVREFTLRTYAKLLEPTNLQIFTRTTIMAATVTAACIVVAFPLAYYMARHASPRMKTFLYLAVTLPLWSSYVVRVYSWKLILAQEGIVSWAARILHLDGALSWYLGLPVVGGPSLSVSATGIFLVFVYIWVPYMILPIETALERVPKSLLDASGDLGARPSQTFRNVILPLALPGVVYLMENTHMSFGVLLTIVVVARLVWRWIPGHQRSPLELGWMRIASKATHYLLYALLVAEAGLGFAFRWGAGRPMEFFGLGIPPLTGARGKPLRHDLREIHNWIGWAILIVAALHALAALYHHYVLKDRVLKRMLPAA